MIYTTPLKALSNQKLLEMRTWFGEESVGLQTGDQSLNVEGDVVIMTTEVLRNILYRSSGVDQAGVRLLHQRCSQKYFRSTSSNCACVVLVPVGHLGLTC